MPYQRDEDVPKYVPKDKRRRWRNVWNAVYARTGDEGLAFAIANKYVLRKEGRALSDQANEQALVGTSASGHSGIEDVDLSQYFPTADSLDELAAEFSSDAERELAGTPYHINGNVVEFNGEDWVMWSVKDVLDYVEAQKKVKTKREAGTDWEAKWFAYVPDPDKPSTWKLRLGELVNGKKKITRRQLGRAAAALSPGGFRGRRVQIPKRDLPKVKARIRAEYKKLGVPDDEIPKSVREALGCDVDVTSLFEAKEVPGLGPMFFREHFQTKPEILESPTEENSGILRFKAVIGVVDKPTANGNLYPSEVVAAKFGALNETLVSEGKYVGEVDHPVFGLGSLERSCIVWEKLWVENGKQYGIGRILPTEPWGKNLQTQILGGMGIGFSSRCLGTRVPSEDDENVLVVQDDLRFLGHDAVILAAADGTGVEEILDDVRGDTEQTVAESVVTPQPEREHTESPEPAVNKDDDAPGTTETASDSDVQVSTDVGQIASDERLSDAGPQAYPSTQESEPEIEESEQKPLEEGDMSEVEKKIQELEQRLAEQQKQLARERIEKVIEESGLIEEAHKALLRTHLEGAETPEEVNERFESFKPQIEALKGVEKKYTGIGVVVKEKDQIQLAPDTEPRPAPKTIAEVIAAASEGLPGDPLRDVRLENLLSEGPEAIERVKALKGINPFDSQRWVFEQLLWNMAKHPEYRKYLVVHTEAGRQALRQRLLTETTTTSDITAGNPAILPLIRATYPKIIAHEICSVQPIAVPAAKVYYLEPQYDSGAHANQNISDSQYFDRTWATHTEESAKAKVQLSISSADVTMVEKAVQLTWTHQVQQDLAAYFNISAEDELVRDGSDYLAMEVNFDILYDMLSNALYSSTYGTNLPTGWTADGTSRDYWDKYLGQYLVDLAGKINNDRHAQPTFIVTDPRLLRRLAVLPGFEPVNDVRMFGKGVVQNFRYLGMAGFSVSWLSDVGGADKILIGVKTGNWNDVAYVWAPFIPAYITPRDYNTSTNVASIAVGTRYGKKLVRTGAFGVCTISATTGSLL